MTNHEKIKKIAFNSIFIALVIVLAFIPIRIGVIEMTLVIIPLAVGAIIGGVSTGLILGTTFGLVSFIQCLGYSPFGYTLLTINPLLTFLVCVPTRMLVGYVAGMLSKVFKNLNVKPYIKNTIISVVVPVLNTLLFTGVLILCFYQSDFIQGLKTTLGATNIFMFAVLFVGLNGLVEIIVGIFASLPIATALEKYLK